MTSGATASVGCTVFLSCPTFFPNTSEETEEQVEYTLKNVDVSRHILSGHHAFCPLLGVRVLLGWWVGIG